MSEPIWEKMFRGERVSLSLDDITNHRLREMKSVFGADYGIPSQFSYLLALGDADALTCALWIHGQVSGKPVGPMLELDWKVSDFENVPEQPKRKPAPKGKSQDTSDETGLTPIP